MSEVPTYTTETIATSVEEAQVPEAGVVRCPIRRMCAGVPTPLDHAEYPAAAWKVIVLGASTDLVQCHLEDEGHTLVIDGGTPGTRAQVYAVLVKDAASGGDSTIEKETGAG